MKYVLDTDHMTFLERGGSEGERVRARLLTISPHDYATTIVTYEEQMRGWLSRVAQAHTTERLVAAYMHLSMHLDVFTGIRVLRFDDRAATEFERLRRLRPRIDTQDTKDHVGRLLDRERAFLPLRYYWRQEGAESPQCLRVAMKLS